MDATKRQITKIAREVSKLVQQTMKADGIGTAEFDFIHLVRHHPGITQADIREKLKIDKGACARRAANLEAKGLLIRKKNLQDGRSQLLYATNEAEKLKNSKTAIEATFYDWLLEELDPSEKKAFCQTLNKLYERSKNERNNGFVHVAAAIKKVSENETDN